MQAGLSRRPPDRSLQRSHTQSRLFRQPAATGKHRLTAGSSPSVTRRSTGRWVASRSTSRPSAWRQALYRWCPFTPAIQGSDAAMPPRGGHRLVARRSRWRWPLARLGATQNDRSRTGAAPPPGPRDECRSTDQAVSYANDIGAEGRPECSSRPPPKVTGTPAPYDGCGALSVGRGRFD